MWATEVQKVDIETLPKFEERELFRTYMEDFNTGTLPHRKYYNLEVYERRRAEKAAKKKKPLVRHWASWLIASLLYFELDVWIAFRDWVEIAAGFRVWVG
jgi:hypothetical protein